MVTRFATFAIEGPFKNCYGTIEAESEHHIRQWLRLHFPVDWAGIYHDGEFPELRRKYALREIFVTKLGHTNYIGEETSSCHVMKTQSGKSM